MINQRWGRQKETECCQENSVGGEDRTRLAKLAGCPHLCRARREDSRPREMQLQDPLARRDLDSPEEAEVTEGE